MKRSEIAKKFMRILQRLDLPGVEGRIFFGVAPKGTEFPYVTFSTGGGQGYRGSATAVPIWLMQEDYLSRETWDISIWGGATEVTMIEEALAEGIDAILPKDEGFVSFLWDHTGAMIEKENLPDKIIYVQIFSVEVIVARSSRK